MHNILKRLIATIMSIVVVFSSLYISHEFDMNTEVHASTNYFESTIEGFPESYKVYLRKLHDKYPNWKFTPLITGLDWDDAVSEQSSNNKSLVVKTASELLKSNVSGDYNVSTGKYIYKDSTSWVVASENVVAYYMDPRNLLNEVNVFQFEDITYNSSIHTQAGVEQILYGTFMSNKKITYYNTSGKKKKINKKYSMVIMQAAKKSGVSPYYLASKIRQEVGVNGSGSTSGKYSKKYKGYYNFFNIGASDSVAPIANGLSFASGKGSYSRPWNTPEKAILGGAKYIGKEFVESGQLNGYLLKFNVNPDSKWGLYSHQYMTNLTGACQESVTSYSAYVKRGTLSQTKEFLIPVYKNMPDLDNDINIPLSKDKGTVSANCRVYKNADVNSKAVGTVKRSNTIQILDGTITKGEYSYDALKYPYWYKVRYKNKKGKSVTGYLLAKNLKIKSSITIGKKQSYMFDVYKSTSKDDAVYYRSSNPSMATVNSKGQVSTKNKEGSVTIYAFLGNGSFDAITIKISGEGAVKMNADSKMMYIGKKVRLRARVSSTKLKDKTLKWYSSDNSIAKVNRNGVVTGVKAGVVIVTAKASSGVGNTCIVRVKPMPAKEFTAVVSTSKLVRLEWNKSKGARGYVIYRKAKNEKKYTQIKKINKRNTKKYIDRSVESNKQYSYRIRSYYKYEGEMLYSSYSTLKTTAKPRTTLITSANSCRENTAVTLSWRYRGDVDGYVIYRRTGNRKFKLLRVVRGVDKIKFRDEGLKPGRTYYYRVKTYNDIDDKRVYSDFSKTIRVTMK